MSAMQRKGWSRYVILGVAALMTVAWLILHQFCGVSLREFVVGLAGWTVSIAAIGICIGLCLPKKTPM